MTFEEQRKLFKKTLGARYCYDRDENGSYVDWDTLHAWSGWSAKAYSKGDKMYISNIKNTWLRRITLIIFILPIIIVAFIYQAVISGKEFTTDLITAIKTSWIGNNNNGVHLGM